MSFNRLYVVSNGRDIHAIPIGPDFEELIRAFEPLMGPNSMLSGPIIPLLVPSLAFKVANFVERFDLMDA